jgi:hypothetical protein
MRFVHGSALSDDLATRTASLTCYHSAEEHNLSSVENNPSWLLPLLPLFTTPDVTSDNVGADLPAATAVVEICAGVLDEMSPF